MNFIVIQRVIGILLMLFSFTMLPPLFVSWIYNDGVSFPFVFGFGLALIAGLIFWFPVRSNRKDLKLRDGFVIVVMFWTVLSLFGSLPLVLSDHTDISFTDAVFESVSGLTTTGATVLTGLDNLPESIQFYRQQLQWLGGMGIIVLAVAILPMLGVGGMQLYRAETPGPMKDSKIMPRVTETAKALWYVYLGLTVVCAVSYWAAGMSVFDAIGHSFSTVAIGGFSTHDASIGYFNSTLIEMIAVVFMLISGINFSLHFIAWRSLSVRHYISDPEVKTYFLILSVATVIVTAYLYASGVFTTLSDSFVSGIFHVVSIGTTTGYATTDYYTWPVFVPVLLIFISFIGGCAGSTGGGMKVIRFLLLFKQGIREITQLIHPNAQLQVKVGSKPLPETVIKAVWGFFSLYVASFCIMMLALMALGVDQVTAFSAVAACINNLGPGLGEVAENYGSLGSAVKWILCFAMLLGRLEIFTLLVLLTPAFWRK